jgi:hypothetical protein
MVIRLGPSRPEFRNYHEREAARLRSLLETATTPALRAWLLARIEEQEQLAEELAEFEAAAAEAET